MWKQKSAGRLGTLFFPKTVHSVVSMSVGTPGVYTSPSSEGTRLQHALADVAAVASRSPVKSTIALPARPNGVSVCLSVCACVYACVLIDVTVLVPICPQVILCYICLAVGCLKQPFGLTFGQLKVSIMHTPVHWFSDYKASEAPTPTLLLIFCRSFY